ncbi:MAG: lytic transglycosylase domain-containing protein, partial [Acidobacteriales bacterium]
MQTRRTVAVWLAASLILGAVFLAGCAGTKQSAKRMSFTPPAAASPDGAFLTSSPPPSEPSLFAHEAPEFLAESLQAPAAASAAGATLRRAEARYQAGRRLFRAGQMEEARKEFDQAIDIMLSGPASGADGQAREKKLTELAEAIHQYDVSGLGAGEPEGEPVFEKAPLDEMPEPTFPMDPKIRNQVAEELKATSSQLPLTLNDDVLRYINYFSSTRGRKILVNGLRRAGRYRPMIQRIFDEEGIPQELIHLAQAESGFAPRAVSRVKATGMWQFMLWRGQEYGLVRTKEKDDRLDPEKATRAAARHLRDLYTQFGDWHLAMAAYNCGPVNVEKAVLRTGYADVWEMRRRNVLPKETSNYLPIILAMVIMAKSPAHYGLDQIEIDPPLEYSTVELDAPLHLNLVADITERPVSEIRELNPALLT